MGAGGAASRWSCWPRGFAGFAAGAVLLGLGTAMVYPTLLAAIGDVAHPSLAGIGGRRLPPLARPGLRRRRAARRRSRPTRFGMRTAIGAVAALTFASGLLVVVRMPETLRSH